MSQENVEIVRSFITDFHAAQTEAAWAGWIDRLAEALDPEVEFDPSAIGAPDIDQTYRRIAEVQRFWRDWLAAWETLEFSYELLDAGDRVVVLLEQRMRGRSTGLELPLWEYAQVITFSSERIVHWKVYMDQAEALEALGLQE
ncbi:MAG: hypothetical protein QOG62_572 [Thermoleophilaceae bacterium]|jgi:LPS sulfotransferase NodH|nr:hypothetical protein [Thermoleophilaceae bacterium]